MILTPTVLIDTREQKPLTIAGFPSRVATLPTGDYSLDGFQGPECLGFAVERKSLDDLASSLGRDRARFMREVERLRAYRFSAILIEAVPDEVELKFYRADIHPNSIFGTLDALQVRAGIHVIWAGSPGGAARQLERLVKAFTRGIERDYQHLAAVCRGTETASGVAETCYQKGLNNEQGCNCATL